MRTQTHRLTRLACLLLCVSLGSALAACNAEPVAETVAETAPAPADQPVPRGFSYLVDGKLAGMAYPGHGEQADSTLSYLDGQGITRLVSLTEEPPVPEKVKAAGIEQVHIPVKDFTAPTIEQLEGFISETRDHLGGGGKVTVHCAGGKGRTGTFLSAWLISEDGMSADDAIKAVRELRPGSVETASQEQILADFAKTLRPAEAGGEVTP